MDAVVDGDSDRDRRDRDRHDVERDPHEAHQTQDAGGREQVGDDADDGQWDGAEEDEEHDRDAGHDRSQTRDLGGVEALEHVVVEHQRARHGHVSVFERKPVPEVVLHSLQELGSS